MNRTRFPIRSLFLISIFLLFFPALLISQNSPGKRTQQATAKPEGIVVEEVGKDSAGEKAGIQVGDILIAWERAANPPSNPQAAKGKILSPFDLPEVEIEQAPRGEVTLSGVRNGKPIKTVLSADSWKLKARPQFSEQILSKYMEGRKAAEA